MDSVSLLGRGWLRVLGTTLILIAVAGCSGAKTQPVRGNVVFKDGTPATGGTVIFEPVDKNIQVSARGDIEPDGSFRLGTYTHDDGAPEGAYHVLVVPPAPPEEKDERRPQRPPISRKYLSPGTSPLKATVTRDRQKNDFTFELDRP
jgi:hypothetical protein